MPGLKTWQWRSLLRAARKGLPDGCSVIVRRRPMKKDCGHMRFDGRRYTVTVGSNQSAQGQIDALIHEFAHILAIEAAYGHGKAFGEAYGAMYCVCNDYIEEVTS